MICCMKIYQSECHKAMLINLAEFLIGTSQIRNIILKEKQLGKISKEEKEEYVLVFDIFNLNLQNKITYITVFIR